MKSSFGPPLRVNYEINVDKDGSYYRLVAQNFLRNISLDGTHSNTSYRIFQTSTQEDCSSNGASGIPQLAKRNSISTGATAGETSLATTSTTVPQERVPSVTAPAVVTPDSRSSPGTSASSTKKVRIRHRSSRRRLIPFRRQTSSADDNVDGISLFQKLTNMLVPGGAELSASIALGRDLSLPKIYSDVILDDQQAVPRKESRRVNRDAADVAKQCRALAPSDLFELAPFSSKDEVSYAALLHPSPKEQNTISKRLLANDGVISFEQTFAGTPCKPIAVAAFNTPPPSPPKHSALKAFEFDPLLLLDEGPVIGLPHQQSFYDPGALSDTHFGPGKHKTTLSFPSYLTSIIDYATPGDAKKEANEKFCERYPDIRLTYSKLKSLKREMKKISVESSLDLFTLAQSYVYFEKCILKSLINKTNRKLIAGTSIILAAKINDVKGQQFRLLVEKIESTFRSGRKELFSFELPLIVALNFALLVPDSEIFPHYQRLVDAR